MGFLILCLPLFQLFYPLYFFLLFSCSLTSKNSFSILLGMWSISEIYSAFETFFSCWVEFFEILSLIFMLSFCSSVWGWYGTWEGMDPKRSVKRFCCCTISLGIDNDSFGLMGHPLFSVLLFSELDGLMSFFVVINSFVIPGWWNPFIVWRIIPGSPHPLL